MLYLLSRDKYEVNSEGGNILVILLHIQINIIVTGFT